MLSESKNLDGIMDDPEILRYALNEIMLWVFYFDKSTTHLSMFRVSSGLKLTPIL